MIRKILIFLFIIFVFSNNAYAKADFYDYLKDVKYQVEKTWNAPVYYLKHTSEVYFKINKDGTVSDIKLSKSSKVPQLDTRAVDTVKKLPKFSKFPPDYIGDFIEVTAAFTNFVYEDLRNPNIYQQKSNMKRNELVPVNTKRVKIVKVVYDEFFTNGNSNYQNNMKDLVLNVDIQRALAN